eukprot:5012746-Pleurochrysis_carterae.AAC.1
MPERHADRSASHRLHRPRALAFPATPALPLVRTVAAKSVFNAAKRRHASACDRAHAGAVKLGFPLGL